MKNILFISVFGLSIGIFSQGNCSLYLKESNEYKACELAYKALKHRQGSKKSQILFDSIIKLNPKYAWAYREKSVPYFKRGFVLKGLELLNKAVDLEPNNYLCYRAYWYFQNRNYKLSIRDLERYYSLPNSYPNELTPGGDMDMKFLLGMAYAKLGNLEKGISVVKNCIANYKNKSEVGLVDYHILGMLYYKNKENIKAIKFLKNQLEINKDYADTYYYLGLAYKKMSRFKKAKEQFEKALAKFNDEYQMKNGYICFRVYEVDVLNEMEKLKK